MSVEQGHAIVFLDGHGHVTTILRGADTFGGLAQRHRAHGRVASVIDQQQGAAGGVRDKQLPPGGVGGDAARTLAGCNLAHYLVGPVSITLKVPDFSLGT
ncbi:hypothetical protein [Janthinobacterium lividum]|uniref:hypothetical protein n=1 Tax=Janthinobacterium lividum TaxID=29581 RepID=UPI002093C753|nr:hypothetical protein [Janthinobacterium lividum]